MSAGCPQRVFAQPLQQLLPGERYGDEVSHGGAAAQRIHGVGVAFFVGLRRRGPLRVIRLTRIAGVGVLGLPGGESRTKSSKLWSFIMSAKLSNDCRSSSPTVAETDSPAESVFASWAPLASACGVRASGAGSAEGVCEGSP